MMIYVNGLVEGIGLLVNRTRNFLQEHFGRCFTSAYASLAGEQRQRRHLSNKAQRSKFYFNLGHAAVLTGLFLATYT